MVFCSECGVKGDETSKFCGNCGTALQDRTFSGSSVITSDYDSHPVKDISSGYQDITYRTGFQSYADNNTYETPKKPANRFIGNQAPIPPSSLPKTGLLQLVIVINWIVFAILALITVLAAIIFFPAAIIVGLFAALSYWIVRGLSNLNNNARIVALVLSVIGLISDVFNLMSGQSSILSLLVGAITVYTLGFHNPTKELFNLYT